MGLGQRFTRDAASKYVWGGLLLIAIAGLVFSFTAGADAVRQERLRAEQRSVAAVEDVISPRLEGADLGAPLEGQDLSVARDAVAGSIGADPRVARVRIWSEDGALLFSTDRSDDIGSSEALNDELLLQAGQGDTLTRWNVSDVGGTDAAERSLLRTYTPLRAAAVAEIDHTEEGTVGPVARQWLSYRILAGVAVALFLTMALLSLREPLDRINTGVRFSRSAVPAGYAVIEEERLHAVEEVYRLAHERVSRLEARLAESEEDRRRLEGVLQRALTGASTGSAPTAAGAATPPTPPAPPPLQPIAVPIEEKRGLLRRAIEPARANEVPAGSEPKRRRTKRSAAPATDERPAAETPAPATAAEVPAPDVVTVPDSEVLGDDWAAASASALLGRAAGEDGREKAPKPSTEPEKPKRQRSRRKTESATAAVASDTDADAAAAHEAALETFIRLTERDRQPHETADVDQGAVRAALARTAARKKPGGTKLQRQDEPVHEVQGGGPSRDQS